MVVLPTVDARGRALPGAHGREAAGADLPDNGASPLNPTLIFTPNLTAAAVMVPTFQTTVRLARRHVQLKYSHHFLPGYAPVACAE